MSQLAAKFYASRIPLAGVSAGTAGRTNYRRHGHVPVTASNMRVETTRAEIRPNHAHIDGGGASGWVLDYTIAKPPVLCRVCSSTAALALAHRHAAPIGTVWSRPKG